MKTTLLSLTLSVFMFLSGCTSPVTKEEPQATPVPKADVLTIRYVYEADTITMNLLLHKGDDYSIYLPTQNYTLETTSSENVKKEIYTWKHNDRYTNCITTYKNTDKQTALEHFTAEYSNYDIENRGDYYYGLTPEGYCLLFQIYENEKNIYIYSSTSSIIECILSFYAPKETFRFDSHVITPESKIATYSKILDYATNDNYSNYECTYGLFDIDSDGSLELIINDYESSYTVFRLEGDIPLQVGSLTSDNGLYTYDSSLYFVKDQSGLLKYVPVSFDDNKIVNPDFLESTQTQEELNEIDNNATEFEMVPIDDLSLLTKAFN